MREDLNEQFGYKAELKPGTRGSFEVFLNNQLIFSKLQTGRFPEDNEIITFIEDLLNVI